MKQQIQLLLNIHLALVADETHIKFFCCFLILNLFYRVNTMVDFKETIYIFQGSRGPTFNQVGPTFSRGSNYC